MQVFTHWRGGAEAGAAQAVAEHGKGTECPGVEAARKPGHKGKTPTMYKCRCMVKSGLLICLCARRSRRTTKDAPGSVKDAGHL